jgi:hypothetical protein
MKKEIRIPTLIAIFVLIIGLVVTSFLTGQAQRLFTQADVATQPKNVKVSNITDTSFSVSWITDQEIPGAVLYSDSKNSPKPIQDDRVQAGQQNDKFLTHHITVRFLKPNSTYTYKIISGKQEYTDSSYKITTAPNANNAAVSTPVYGTILKSDQTPAIGALVYVSVKDSTLLSTITKSNGNWLVTLNNARTKDLSSPMFFNARGDKEEIFVQADKDNVSTVKTVTGNDAPLPTVILGKDYDFTKEQEMSSNNQEEKPATPTPTALMVAAVGGTSSLETKTSVSLTPTPTTGSTESATFVSSPPISKEPAILTPSNNSVISDSRPTIKGIGVPGQVVQIIVHSDQNLVASVIIGSDGRWDWTPPQDLNPGEHTVTIATSDSSGKVKSLTQKFIVLASGTSVVESATPSATIIPTSIPTSITISPSPLPASGSIEQTSLLFFLGMSILILGAIVFYAGAF